MDFSRSIRSEYFKEKTEKLRNRLLRGRAINQTQLSEINLSRPTYVSFYFIFKF